MAIKMMQGFDIRSTNPIDKRIVMTKAEMLAANPNLFPDLYFAWCSDDDKLYVYKKNGTAREETGLFIPYEEVLDIPAAIQATMQTPEGKAALEEAIGGALPGAIEEAMSDQETAQAIADAMFDSEHFALTVDKKIDLAISLIQAIDSN